MRYLYTSLKLGVSEDVWMVYLFHVLTEIQIEPYPLHRVEGVSLAGHINWRDRRLLYFSVVHPSRSISAKNVR